jgi:ribonuclease HI
MLKRLKVYSDGGARGNPGPAALAFLIFSEDNKILHAQSFFLGKRTNNQAEYEALITALEAAAALEAREVECYLDSELVAKQLRGEYQVKNVELLKLWKKTRELTRCFKKVNFVNVPRTNCYIQEADRLVNERLDEAEK